MVWAAMMKWLILEAVAEEPPELTRQILEPWTWLSLTWGDIQSQIMEPWTWDFVLPPTLTRQILEEWGS